MSVTTLKEAKKHVGHEIAVVMYKNRPNEVYIECETCYEVLVEFNSKSGITRKKRGKK